MNFTFSNGQIHIHHWFSAAIISSLCGHPNIGVTIVHALCYGTMVEGCTRWAMDCCWEVKLSALNDTFKSWVNVKIEDKKKYSELN